MQSNKKTWDKWELIAIKYLKSKWYEIKDTNFKFGRFWEIDIIANINYTTIFIEVKFRKNLNYWEPEDSITKEKLRRLKRTIDYYVVKNKIDFEKIRFDAITILKEEKSYKLKHYKNLEI